MPSRRLSGETRIPARVSALVPATNVVQRFSASSAARPWQAEVREYDRDGPGVCGFYLDLVQLLASLCPLVAETRNTSGEWVKSSDAVLNTLLDGYVSPLATQSELIGEHVRHRESMGEAWLIDSEHLGWNVVTVPNVTVAGDTIQWTDPYGRKRITPQRRVWKSWVRDPYEPWQPVSPLRRAIPDLRRLRAAMRNQTRSAESPLATNGILAFADDQGSTRPLAEEPHHFTGADQVVSDFLDLAKISSKDDDSVAAAVPFPVVGPPPTYVEVGRGIDSTSLQVEDKALEAFSRSVNFPAQLLTNGPGSSNHWNEWLLEESQRKMGLSPKMRPACDDVTQAYYRPMLSLARERIGDLEGIELHRVRVGFDTSFLTSQPDNTAQLLQAWGNGVIKREYIVEALNLPEEAILDIPEGMAEYAHWELATNKPGAPYAEVDAEGALVAAPDVFGDLGGSPEDTFGDGSLPPQDAELVPQQLPGVAPADPAALATPEPSADGFGANNRAMPAPPPQLAALTEDQRVEEQVIDRLYRADVALEASLSARAAVCVETVTDKVAREIVKAHPSGSETRATLRELPSVKVWAAADPDIQASFPLQETVSDAVDQCADDRPFRDAAAAALAAVAPLGVTPRFDEDSGSTLLRVAVIGFIVSRFERGGGSDNFPAQDIRAAMASAGGAVVGGDGSLQRTGSGTPVPTEGGTWVGNTGMTTGHNVFSQWATRPDGQPPATGLRWEWVHSFYGKPETPFPPHVELDGQTFNTLADIPGGMHPGDHQGCRCCVMAVLLPVLVTVDDFDVDVPAVPLVPVS